MAFFTNPQKLAELTSDIPVVDNNESGVINTLKQIDRLIDFIKSEGRTSEDDAKKIISASIFAEAAKKGGDAREVWASYPESIRKKLFYGPEDLERNQEVTVLGLKLSVSAFIGSFIAAVATAIIASRYAAFLPPLLRVPLIVSIPAIIAAFLQRIGWTISTMTNNWNDVFHWGPLQISQQLRQLEGKAQTSAPTPPTPRTRLTMSKTAKPVLFLGTIFSQIVKRVDAFERVVDDKITDKDDLRADAQANLNKWLSTLPGRLLFTIDIRNNPFDEFGVKQTGTWATLTILIRSLSGKTTPLDTILLGPIDPTVYMPKSQEIQTVQIELPKLLTAEEIAQVQLPTGEIKLVDKSGTIVPALFPESKPAPTPAVVSPAPAAPTAPTAPAVAPAPTPAQVPTVTPAPAPAPVAAPAPVLTEAEKAKLAEQEEIRKRLGIIQPAPPGFPGQLQELTIGATGELTPKIVSPAPAPAPTPAPTPAPAPAQLKIETFTAPSRGWFINTPGSCLNIRKSPGLSAEKIACHGHNQPVGPADFPAQRVRNIDGFDWVHISSGAGIGWVAEQFLTPRT
jgi:hypothetical protein